MKHIFIINPAAGKGKAEKIFLPQIIETAKRMGIDYEIHRTIAPGDARHFVSGRCEARKTHQGAEADAVRFYACGGDGTLNEVVNGAYSYQNAEIAMIPAGTGNDFPRNFGHLKYFENIELQILGEAKAIDIIRYEERSANRSEANAGENQDAAVRYGINMFNMGFDCNVADKAAEIKNHPFVGGSLAYGVGVGVVLGKKEGVNLEIKFDDGENHNGYIMLMAIGNGCFYGGGFKGTPRASVDDGLIDVSIIENISRRTLLSLLGKYRKGTHLEDPSTARIITYRKCRSLTIKPPDTVKVCIDGEISIVGEGTFEIVSKGIKFSVPQGCE